MIAKIQNKKGFTLVEVIVVLIILAILAAILVPSLTGYIDKANEKVAVAEARAFLIAAQVYASEEYASTGAVERDEVGEADSLVTEAHELAEDSGVVTKFSTAGGKVTGFTYTVGKAIVEYDGSAFTTSQS